ncbi:MAG: hypothetical protein NZ870_03710, partial [bacterium]|nr:hypothetical protein [bacterium]
GDKVFGSVTKNKILKEIRKLIPEFESSWLQLEHPLKEFKSFEIPFVINKAEGIEGKIVVKVERI